MKKKLLITLLVLTLLLACALGVIVYLERRPGDEIVPGTAPASSADGTVNPGETAQNPTETETPEETLGISLPTEDPADVMPEETFGEDDYVPPVTQDPDATYATEDRDSNELPEDVF